MQHGEDVKKSASMKQQFSELKEKLLRSESTQEETSNKLTSALEELKVTNESGERHLKGKDDAISSLRRQVELLESHLETISIRYNKVKSLDARNDDENDISGVSVVCYVCFLALLVTYVVHSNRRRKPRSCNGFCVMSEIGSNVKLRL